MAEQSTKLSVNQAEPAGAPAPRHAGWPGFGDLRREMDRLFDDFGRGFFAEPRWPALIREPLKGFDLTPAVDVVESDGQYRITVEVPGIDAKAIEVGVTGDMLTIKGEKSETKDEDVKGTHVSERRYGSFARSFRLPEGVDRAAIDAAVKDGVLTLTLPKSPEAKDSARKIEVKSA